MHQPEIYTAPFRHPFLLGFSFSLAVNRCELRRDLVVEEPNAIGPTIPIDSSDPI